MLKDRRRAKERVLRTQRYKAEALSEERAIDAKNEGKGGTKAIGKGEESKEMAKIEEIIDPKDIKEIGETALKAIEGSEEIRGRSLREIEEIEEIEIK